MTFDSITHASISDTLAALDHETRGQYRRERATPRALPVDKEDRMSDALASYRTVASVSPLVSYAQRASAYEQAMNAALNAGDDYAACVAFATDAANKVAA